MAAALHNYVNLSYDEICTVLQQCKLCADRLMQCVSPKLPMEAYF